MGGVLGLLGGWEGGRVGVRYTLEVVLVPYAYVSDLAVGDLYGHFLLACMAASLEKKLTGSTKNRSRKMYP